MAAAFHIFRIHHPVMWKVPRSRWICRTCPLWLWGCSFFKISTPGAVFHETQWFLWRPHR
jgi:hypothetical protein